MIHFLQGTNPAYPPQNPVYPPTNPTMMPPNQFPQWNGPPPGQYPPGPAAPMVMLNSMCLEERNTGPLTFKLHSVYGQPIVNWPWGGRGAGFFLNVCIQHVCGERLLTSVRVCSGTECVTLSRSVCVKGYMAAPVMYNAAPKSDQAKEEIQMENMASLPTDTLLTSTAQVFKHPLLLSVNKNNHILKSITFFTQFSFSYISLFGLT